MSIGFDMSDPWLATRRSAPPSASFGKFTATLARLRLVQHQDQLRGRREPTSQRADPRQPAFRLFDGVSVMQLFEHPLVDEGGFIQAA
jgi:hypothetical protein